MEYDPLKSELRRLRREARLGEKACCILCGESDLKGLIPVNASCLRNIMWSERHMIQISASASAAPVTKRLLRTSSTLEQICARNRPSCSG